MKATIYSNKTIIGTTELQIGDASMGCVYGQFTPNDNYFKDVQKHVWEFWATNKPDYSKWHSLRLNVQLENGYFLFPCGGYTIDDLENLPDEPKRIDIAGIDLHMFNCSNDFLLEPWSKIDIGEKIALEDELKKEIIPDKILFEFFKPKDNHILLGSEVSAFARYGPNDDVLFEINKRRCDERFAVVHLTWSSKKDANSDFPDTTFYYDFSDFTERRMKQDCNDEEYK